MDIVMLMFELNSTSFELILMAMDFKLAISQ